MTDHHSISSRRRDLALAEKHDDHPLVEKLRAEIADLEAHEAVLGIAEPKLASLERESAKVKGELEAARRAVGAGTRDAEQAVERERVVVVLAARVRAIAHEIAPVKSAVASRRAALAHAVDKGRMRASAATGGLAVSLRRYGGAHAATQAADQGRAAWKHEERIWLGHCERQVLAELDAEIGREDGKASGKLRAEREALVETFAIRSRWIAETKRGARVMAERALAEASA